MAAGYNLLLNLIVKGMAGVAQLQNGLRKVDRQGQSLASTFRLMRVALVAFAGSAVYGRIIALEKNIEKTKVSFNALTGSVAAGNQAFQSAANFSAEFGFELNKTLKATQDLLLAGNELKDIPNILRVLGGVSRTTGVDIDSLAEEFTKLKTEGAASAKTLGRLLEKELGKTVYDSIKNNVGLSVREFELLGPKLGTALQSGTGGINQALNDLGQNWDKFLQTFLGTDNAGKINHLNKALERFTEQLPALQIAVGGLLILSGKGALVGVPLLVKGFYDLYMQTQQTGVGVKSLKEQLTEAQAETGGLYTGISNLNKQFMTAPVALNSMTMAIEKCEEGMAGLTAEFDKLLKIQKEVLAQVTAFENNYKTLGQTIYKEFSTANIALDSMRSAFNSIDNAATEAFVGIIRGTMTARDAGRMLANAIVTELVTAFVRLFIVGPLMRLLAEYIFGIVDAQDAETQALKKTNKELMKYIGLRTFAAIFGFAKGGPVKEGGPEARAMGGPTAGNTPYLVGERGPELFVPNSDGYIVPNDKLNMGSGSAYGMSTSGTTNITFNINTVDARDFDKLLMTRQDMIIGLINRGLQERGKRSLTA